jgi:hypothetical protein
MTRDEAKQHISDVAAGRKPEREIEVRELDANGDYDGSIRLRLWADGSVTWK